MNVSLDQAEAFCAVVDLGGYLPAAKKLNKSHSSLIYSVRTLEDQCGLILFNRKSYRNQLTSTGRQIYIKCQELLGKAEELKSLCESFTSGWEPSLKIVLDGVLPFAPFLKVYHHFQANKIPTVVQTYTGYLEDVEVSFDNFKADIMISILPVSRNNMRPIYLMPIKSLLVAHRDHPIHLKNKRWSVEEMKAFDFLTIRGSSNKIGLNTDEFEQTASFFFSDFSAKKSALLLKTGFGWLPQHMIEKEMKSGLLKLVKWNRESTQKIQPLLYISPQSSKGRAAQVIVEQLSRF